MNMDRLFYEPPQTYRLTVHSDEVSAGNFYAHLPKPLAFGNGFYEVALLRIQIYKINKNVPVKPEITGLTQATKVPQLDKLFSDYKEPTTQFFQYLYQTKSNIADFCLHLSTQFKMKGFPVRVRAEQVNDTEVVARLHVEHWDVNKYIILDPFLSVVLGFTRRSFYLGTYMGASLLTAEALSLLNPTISYDNASVTFTSRDNVITLDNMYEELIVLVKKRTEFQAFLNDCVAHFVELGYELILALQPDNKVALKLDSVNSSDEYIILPTNLSECFGFNGSGRFTVGTYMSARAYSDSVFKGFNADETFVVTAARYHTLLLPMREPSTSNFEAILMEINETFVRNNLDDLRPHFKIEDGKISVENLSDSSSCRLPKEVNSFFGLPEDAVFKQNTILAVGPEVNQAERIQAAEMSVPDVASDILPQAGGNTEDALVLLDCVEPQIYGNRVAPILDHISWDINTGINFERTSLIYLPLTCQHVDHFRVTLTDSSLKELSLPGYYTVLTLHFRPRFY